MHTVISLQSSCVPLKWVKTQWAIKFKSFQLCSSKTKYIGMIHPTAIPLKALQKPYLYFHCSVSTEMVGITLGKVILIPSTQFYYAPPPESGGVLCYTLRNFECPSVRPSVCLSVRPSVRPSAPTTILVSATPPTVLGQSF